MFIDVPQIYMPTMYYPTVSSAGVGAEALAIKKTFQVVCDQNIVSSFLVTDAQKFSMLASTWEKDTLLISSSSQMFSNESYLQIIGMGEKALPYIFADLNKEPNHWFVALKSITGVDPVSLEHRGDVSKMTEDWLTWAHENNHFF